MFGIFANGKQTAYGIKSYVVDTTSDIATLPTDDTPGSQAFVIDVSENYMLNNQHQWIKIKLTTGSSSGGGDNDDEIVYDEIIYDGGAV